MRLFILVACFVIVATDSPAAQVKVDDASAHETRAKDMSKGGDVDGAISEYREALRLKPDFPEAHLGLGISLRRKGDLNAALSEYREALRLRPDFSEAHNSLGAALGSEGDSEGAVKEFREALRLMPDNHQARFNLAVALSHKGDLDGAIAEYREILRRSPNNQQAHANLGVALSSKGNLDGAIAEFREASRLSPDDPIAHNNVGLALRSKGDLNGATAEYREALRLRPSFVDAHNNLGSALGSKGDLGGAVNEIREVLRLAPENQQAHLNLGIALRSKGDLDGAIAELREALRLEPDDPIAQRNLHLALGRKGDSDADLALSRDGAIANQGNKVSGSMPRDKISMHNAIVKGDTTTMTMLLDGGSVKLDDWVGFGNVQTWVEDACWVGSPVALEYLLQHGADTLRSDIVRLDKDGLPTKAAGWQQQNALAWCIGGGFLDFISSDGSSSPIRGRRGAADSAKVFRVFIKYFEEQLKKTTDPRKAIYEQVAMAGGTGPLIWNAVENQYDDVCLEKTKWLVESGQDITDFKRAADWQKFLEDRSKSNPNCVAYVRDQLQKREKPTHAKE